MYKRLASTVLPKHTYGRAARLWRTRGDFVWNLKNDFLWVKPELLVHFGIAPGDDLLCTAVLRELAKRNQNRIWMMSKFPELFRGSRDIDRVVPIDQRFQNYASRRGITYKLLEYSTIDRENDISVPPKRHIIAELCQRCDIKGEISLRPYFQLTESEKNSANWAKGMIAIQSSGLAAKFPMRNKQWFPERFQEVAQQLQDRFSFVQLGSDGDPPLVGVTDLRGKTGIRESAAILAQCQSFVGNVGFLMHLARSVECPAVIVFGGREAPWQSGYICNINLYSAVPCAPCWLWNKCDHARICMDNITAEHVVNAVGEINSRTPGSLAVEICSIN